MHNLQLDAYPDLYRQMDEELNQAQLEYSKSKDETSGNSEKSSRELAAMVEKLTFTRSKAEKEEKRLYERLQKKHPFCLFFPGFFSGLFAMDILLKELSLKAIFVVPYVFYDVMTPYFLRTESLILDLNPFRKPFYTQFHLFLSPQTSRISKLSLRCVNLTDDCCFELVKHLKTAPADSPLEALDLSGNEGHLTQRGLAAIESVRSTTKTEIILDSMRITEPNQMPCVKADPVLKACTA